MATYIYRGRGAPKAYKFHAALALAAAAALAAVVLLRLAFSHVWDHVPRRPRGGLLLLHAVALPELPAAEI